jgi:DNA primase
MLMNDLYKIPITNIAEKLGMKLFGNAAKCLNKSNHKNGDEHPSLQLNKKSNTWNCHVCQFRFGKYGERLYGNNLDLVLAVNRFEYKEALEWFNINFGIKPLTNNFYETILKASTKKESIDDEIKHRNYVYTTLMDICDGLDHRAKSYFHQRGFNNWIIREYNLFTIKNDTEKRLLQKCGIDSLQKTGLLNKNDQLIFRTGSIITPFYYFDDLVYLQARNYTGSKYINAKVEMLFPYNINNLLFDDISNDYCFIVEGTFDTLTLAQNLVNVIGITGAKNFKQSWINYFKIRDVIPVIALDNDDTGKKAAKKLIELFQKEALKVKTILPSRFGDYKDWNEILTANTKRKEISDGITK